MQRAMQASQDASSYVRKHTTQISISDDNHHVTEAIGGMYGSDDDDYLSPSNRISRSRPLSFIGSAAEVYQLSPSYIDTKRSSPPRSPLQQTGSNEKLPQSDAISPKGSLGSENTPLSPTSPPSLSRKSSSSADTAVQQFPLNDIDYESSPAAVAQELNNLQAIRRMSMSVDTADPDLPSFGSPSSATSPEAADEEESPGSFWVPARLHPELAPKEFKTFVEDRVDLIRKRSGSGDSLLPGLDRSNSGGLTRKKSMLSRQIDSSKGYEDGAERLQRKRSESGQAHPVPTVENLQELEGLVSNVNLNATRNSLDSGVHMADDQDKPILPAPGPALKRSTRTYMRKDRTPFSRRAMSRHSDRQSESDSEPPRAPSPTVPAQQPEPTPGIKRVQTDPSLTRDSAPPSREGSGRLTSTSSENLVDDQNKTARANGQSHEPSQDTAPRTTFHSRIASNGRTTAPIPGYNSPIPQIVESPPANNYVVPERKSSHAPPSSPTQPPPPRNPAAPRGARSRPPLVTQATSRPVKSTLDDISSNPSPLPGSGSTRTDALTLVPTYDEKKVEKKDSRKTSWNWLLGGEEKDKEKERDRERKGEERDRDREAQRKSKSSSKHGHAKTADKTRLDVLQSSIDGNASSPRGRESLVLDRESIRLDEERKKESSRKSADGKKDKDSGILSAIFGGGKRSKQQQHHGQQHAPKETLRAPSPEPAPRILRPDIDYNWTRFSILEERAIYRMAHMKLANPRRPLHSQVLLSNFMYSYLAKVQMYHPQTQIPAAQKAAQAKQQQQLQQQQQAQQSQDTPPTDDKQGQDQNKYQKWQEVRSLDSHT